MLKRFVLVFSFIISLHCSAETFVGFGGFVPFGLSTQDDVTGGTALFSFDPVLSIGTMMNAFWGQKFISEIGISMRFNEDDQYDKSTLFALFDFGYALQNDLLLRYGLGWFKTSIGGNGSAILINNGSSYATAYNPGETQSSYNATINLGLESQLNSVATLKFETYLFEFLNSDKIDLSYTLTVNYFIKGL